MNSIKKHLIIFACIAMTSSLSYCSNNSSIRMTKAMHPSDVEDNTIGSIQLETTLRDITCIVIDQTSSVGHEIQTKKDVAMYRLKLTIKEVPTFREALKNQSNKVAAIVYDDLNYEPPYVVAITHYQ